MAKVRKRVVRVEIQLMRNWEPFARVSEIDFVTNTSAITASVLYPGSGSMGEHIVIEFVSQGPVQPSWLGFTTKLTINNLGFGSPRPGMFWMGVSDIPSSITHFPIMSGLAESPFSGLYSLLLRAV